MLLRRLRIKDFIRPTESADSHPETPNAYKVCCICSDKEPHAGLLFKRLKQLEPNDRKKVFGGIAKLLKVANMGEPLGSHYDKKQLHDIHTFTYKGHEHTILRIRTGDTRLLFFHADDRIILLLDAFAKHSDTVTAGELATAETAVKSYLDAETVSLIEDKPCTPTSTK